MSTGLLMSREGNSGEEKQQVQRPQGQGNGSVRVAGVRGSLEGTWGLGGDVCSDMT